MWVEYRAVQAEVLGGQRIARRQRRRTDDGNALPFSRARGGGTMLSVEHVDAVYEAGGRLLVSPNCNPAVIRRAADLGMYCAPGVATPTEAFAALDAGAHALKLFPAEMIGHGGLKAFGSVIPAGTPMWPVGGITPETMEGWVRAGATGFGIGGALYTPGVTLDALAERAAAFVGKWRALVV